MIYQFGLTGTNNIRSESQVENLNCISSPIGGVCSSLDYLRVGGKIPMQDLSKVVTFLNGQLDDFLSLDPEAVKPGFLGRLWQNSFKSPLGVRIFYDEIPGGIKILIDIPGIPLRRLSGRNVWRLCLGLKNFNLQCRRFDAALDDYKRRISSAELIKIGESENYALVNSFSVSGKTQKGSKFIPTVYFGSRESEKYLRFYDAEIKHGIPCDRWEVELKRRHAAAAFDEFCSIPLGLSDEDFESFAAQFLSSLVTGCVDFVDSSSDTRYDRQKRLDFWHSLINDVGGSLRLSPDRVKPSLQKTFQWFKKQVSCFLSVAREGYGYQYFYRWLDSILCDSKNRFTPYHRSMIDLIKFEINQGICT